MAPKKIPMRLCVACNEMKPKGTLIRIVKSPDGEVTLDFTGKKNGRGAYLCKNRDCFLKAVKAKKLQRAFECAIDEGVLKALEEEMNTLE